MRRQQKRARLQKVVKSFDWRKRKANRIGAIPEAERAELRTKLRSLIG